MPRRLVEAELAPVVHAAARGERVFRPCLGAELAFLRHAVEYPFELARTHVVGVGVAGIRDVRGAAGRQRHDDQVLEDPSRVAGLQRTQTGDVAMEADPDVHLAVVAEPGERIARPGVDGRQESAVHVQQPAFRAILALPVVHAAVADGAFIAVRPDFLAASRRRSPRSTGWRPARTSRCPRQSD